MHIKNDDFTSSKYQIMLNKLCLESTVQHQNCQTNISWLAQSPKSKRGTEYPTIPRSLPGDQDLPMIITHLVKSSVNKLL